MRATPLHHIVNIYVWVCEVAPDGAKPRGGRPNLLRDSELLTLVIWNALTEVYSPNLKHLYHWIRTYHYGHGREVLHLPHYPGFVAQMPRLVPKFRQLLDRLLASTSRLRFADSTMLEVCRLVRADRHRVAKTVAGFGKNHQGWHYGYKLHLACNARRQLCAVWFTAANEADVLQLRKLVNTRTDIVVGDGGYTACVTRRRLWRDFGCLVISPPRPRQRWLMASWQQRLLRQRPKVEAVFDHLKGQMHLVSSWPRSVHGYAVHYLRVLLGYQAWVGF